DRVENGVGAIGFIGDDVARACPLEQRRRLGDVVRLSGGQDEADRATLGVDREVNLGAQSTSGTPQRRILGPPFPLAAFWCARMMVLSIIRYSLSRSRLRTAKFRSHTPLSAQRMKRLWTLLYLP